jgi:hypothetical protein
MFFWINCRSILTNRHFIAGRRKGRAHKELVTLAPSAMGNKALYLAVSSYITLAQGFSSFDTNCTIPDRTYNYVQGPNTRGSLQIVWSCLATLIACTYTVLHPNLPEQRGGRDGATARYLETWWKRGNPSIMRTALLTTAVVCPWLHTDSGNSHLAQTTMSMPRPKDTEANARLWTPNKLGKEVSWWYRTNYSTVYWMIVTMVAPEVYALIAIYSLESARAHKAEFEKLPLRCHPIYGWTLTHIFFADMGGFVIRSNIESQDPKTTHLTAYSLQQLLQHDSWSTTSEFLPSVEEIQDRSKSDAFAKSLIVLQIVWFVVNSVTRLAKGLPTTQLEMSILGTAICSLLSYLMLLRKPHAVKTATVLLSFDGDMPSHIAEIVETDSDMRGSRGTIKNTQRPSGPPGRKSALWVPLFTFTLLSAILGAFHIAAWNFTFPTETDKLIWRVNSIITCAVIPGVVAVVCIALLIDKALKVVPRMLGWGSDWHDTLTGFTSGLGILLYIISRGILTVEMIRCLFYIPPEAFLTTWADNVPHI